MHIALRDFWGVLTLVCSLIHAALLLQRCVAVICCRLMRRHVVQGQGIECFTANPGIVNTPLNGPKLDHNKLTGNLMDISSSLAGQTTEEASICITRAATDPALAGTCRLTAPAICLSGT